MVIVLKFGGTSLADGRRILAAARRAVALRNRGLQVVVVVSAQGHTTDVLAEQVATICPDAPAKLTDPYLAAGEQLSAGLMALALHSMGQAAVPLTGWQAGLLTDETHGNAQVLALGSDRIRRELDAGRIVVVAGFQGVSRSGDITTLGRGGSDTTAVALAAFLKARLCRIYTDVDGVYDRFPMRSSIRGSAMMICWNLPGRGHRCSTIAAWSWEGNMGCPSRWCRLSVPAKVRWFLMGRIHCCRNCCGIFR